MHRVIEYCGYRRLVEVDDPRLYRVNGGRYLVQSQTGPLAAWQLVEATNDPEHAYRLLHAGRVAGLG